LLNHPTLDQLHTLGLQGMAKAFVEIEAKSEANDLGHREWLGLLLDREASWRRDKRLIARLRYAKLRQQACVEDVDYRSPRGLDRALFQKLAQGDWIEAHDNLALIGPTGVGKSWLASALGHKACRDNRSVLYHRVPKLFEELALARGDGKVSPVKVASSTNRSLDSSTRQSPGTISPAFRLTISPGTISSKSLKNDTGDAQRSSRPNSPWTVGTKSSTIPPTLTPSWTASFTMPTGSN